MYGSLHADDVKSLYDAGSAAYDAKNYEEAVTNLAQVVSMDEKYDNGYAVYYLARSYEALQQNDQAGRDVPEVPGQFPGTSRAKYCTSAIARLGGQVPDPAPRLLRRIRRRSRIREHRIRRPRTRQRSSSDTQNIDNGQKYHR